MSPPHLDAISPQAETVLANIQSKTNNDSRAQLGSLQDDNEDYPEGGPTAWSVVLGAWFAMIPSMGLLNTVGVLQAWVSEHQLQGYSESNIGWIFSAYAFFLYIGGAQVGECVLLNKKNLEEGRELINIIYGRTYL